MKTLNKIMISKGADYDQRLAELSKFAKDNFKRQMGALVGRGLIIQNQKNQRNLKQQELFKNDNFNAVEFDSIEIAFGVNKQS